MDIHEIIDSALSGGPAETAEAEAVETAPAEVPQEGSETETPEGKQAEAQEGAKPEGAPDAAPELDLSDEALSTPEGRAKAREVYAAQQKELAEKQRKNHETWIRLSKREDKIRARVEELKREREAFVTQSRAFYAELEAIDKGGAAEAFAAMARLRKQDPREFYEQVSLHIASNGKGGKEAAKVAELERELANLRAEREREQAERDRREVETWKSQIVRGAQDGAKYPTLSRFARTRPQEVAEELLRIKTDQYQQGEPVSDERALEMLEVALATALQGATGQSPEAGLATSAPAGGQKPAAGLGTGASKAKPGSGGLPGESLPPSLSTQRGSKRELTDEERIREAANDPDFLSQIGVF